MVVERAGCALILMAVAGCQMVRLPPVPSPQPPPDRGRTTRRAERPIEQLRPVSRSSEAPFVFNSNGLELRGTLSIPAHEPGRPVPGVVLVHGSGPISADGELAGELGFRFGKPLLLFRELARALQKAGYAVLRYDKRSCGQFNGCGQNGSAYGWRGNESLLAVCSESEEERRIAAKTEDSDERDGPSQPKPIVPPEAVSLKNLAAELSTFMDVPVQLEKVSDDTQHD